MAIPEVEGYALQHRAGPDRREAIIVFSPNHRFILYRHAFTRDVIFVADLRTRYYLLNARRLAEALMEAIDRAGYEKVLFTGASKGGFAALSIARICAELSPNRFFHVLAFNPQVSLHPPNPNLGYPSYRKLRSLFWKRMPIANAMRRHGDVSLFGDLPNAHATLVYASGSHTDVLEAARLDGPNVIKLEIDGSTHGTVLYFLMRGQPEGVVRSRIQAIYARKGDRDLASSLPRDPERFVQDVLSASHLPTLDALFDQVLAEPPASRPSGWRRGRAVRRLKRLATLALWEMGGVFTWLRMKMSRTRL